jgi:hypothetical protein
MHPGIATGIFLLLLFLGNFLHPSLFLGNFLHPSKEKEFYFKATY